MALDVVAAAESVVVFVFAEVGLAIGLILLVDRVRVFFGWEFVRLQVLQDATEADEFGCHGWLLDVGCCPVGRERLPSVVRVV